MAMPGKARRRAFALLLIGVGVAYPFTVALSNPAKDYPNKPVRFIVPLVAGGGSDVTTRAIAQKLSDTWGRQVVVDNRPGASGVIAVDLTAKAAPDGYTLCMVAASQTINAAINPNLPYEFAKDLAAISQVSSLFLVVYHGPTVPVKSIKELITHAKANPGKLVYGTPGTGSSQHVAVEMFSHMTGAKFTHVPYKGGAAAITAALSGDVQIGFGNPGGLRPHLASGRLRALAITAKQRSPVVPDLPTVAESGVPGYDFDQWYGVVTGARVSPTIINKINGDIMEALKAPEVVKRLAADGSTPAGSRPAEFSAHIRSDIAKWRKLTKDIGLAFN